MKITLIGYRGTGKSSVAPLVASRLGCDSIDVDNHIEQRAGQTIREIFASEGESGFRAREAAAISELSARDRIVIAAGGGAVLRPENRQAIRHNGFTVWLVASVATIAQRIATDSSTASRRPPLTTDDPQNEISKLLRDREKFYQQCADLIVDTEHQTPQQIADQIVEAVTARQLCKPME